ncbi:GyrI-like domain-containing protein [Chryseobacterium sp. C3]|uniref:GyrI-like domain-containing protein n=1 Tax=Chryseobacterium sp. C3 TaxID=2761532 RepID=UPI0016281843
MRFIHYGTHDNIEETYKNFYKFWLSSPNLELDHSPVIEHYLISDKEEENYITHIYFLLKN